MRVKSLPYPALDRELIALPERETHNVNTNNSDYEEKNN